MLYNKTKPQAPDAPKKTPFEVAWEYAQALIYAVALAVIIRGFLFEPFKIPSESMVPTLLVGDHIFVARYQYGLRIPMTKTWITEFGDPKRGDVVVFSYPEDESVDFIKRIVGIPGDKITIKDDVLYVNDKRVEQKDYELDSVDPNDNRHVLLTPEALAAMPEGLRDFPYFRHFKDFQEKIETLDGEHYHYVQRSKTMPIDKEDTWIVPPRHYFAMGDNRDQSQDSRFWGFVPRENLKGKAIFIWLSLDNVRGWFRWGRFGRKIL
jgi:signal peptidase I